MLETEGSGHGNASRKSKAMAGAYSSTYSKLQAQAQLLQPGIQQSIADATASGSQELLTEAERAAAQAASRDFAKHRQAVGEAGLDGLAQPFRGLAADGAGQLADGAGQLVDGAGQMADGAGPLQSALLEAPPALQTRQLRLSKKVSHTQC